MHDACMREIYADLFLFLRFYFFFSKRAIDKVHGCAISRQFLDTATSGAIDRASRIYLIDTRFIRDKKMFSKSRRVYVRKQRVSVHKVTKQCNVSLSWKSEWRNLKSCALDI